MAYCPPNMRGTTAGNTGDMGLLTISYCCNWCKHVLNDDLSWCYVEEGTAGKKANNIMCGMWCASCEHTHNNCDHGCVISMQHTADANERCALLAAMLADGVINATLNALTFANNVHRYHEQKLVFQALSKGSQDVLSKGWTGSIQQGR